MQRLDALFSNIGDDNPFTDETKEGDDRMRELKYPKNSNLNVLDAQVMVDCAFLRVEDRVSKKQTILLLCIDPDELLSSERIDK